MSVNLYEDDGVTIDRSSDCDAGPEREPREKQNKRRIVDIDSWIDTTSSKRQQVSIRNFFSKVRNVNGPRTSSKKRSRFLGMKTPPTPLCDGDLNENTPPTPTEINTTETPPTGFTTIDSETTIFAKEIPVHPSDVKKKVLHKEEMTKVGQNKNRPKPVMTQMYLDLGQRNFAKNTLCPICGMLYVHGVKEDARQHARICKEYIEGVSFQVSNTNVVADFGRDGCIVEIRPSDTYALRQKLKQVRTIVNKELGFSCSGNQIKPYSYLYIRNKRVIGMVTGEIIATAYLLRNSSERSNESHRAMIGIHQLWVHRRHRQKKIASRMVDAARARMVFGMMVPATLVAYSSPTEAGIRFAKRYIENFSADGERTHVLVYDCI